MIEELYLEWLNHPEMDEDLKTELASMNQQQITDAFFKDAEFGTGGMRGILGAGINRLNVYTIRKATLGFGRYLQKNKKDVSVAIAYDNRFYSRKFADEAAKILASLNIKSYVYESLRTTPQLSYTVRHLHCDGGIMITASHNPKEYNGYKVYDRNGCQLVVELINGVIDEINSIEDRFVESPVLSASQQQLINIIGEEVDTDYYKEVLTVQLNPDLTKENFKIVFTPQHGTAYKAIKNLFATVGYDTVYVEEQCNPDPAFSNTLVPNPEDPKAFQLALEYARKVDADIVLSTDPDGDRLGVAVKDGTDYTLMTGNQTGAVLIDYIFSQLTQKGLMPNNPVMFNTIVTSDIGEEIAKSYGVDTEKTLTGFKYIGNKIENHNIAGDKKFVFGYEESYGYLISDFVRDKDANQSCLLIAEAANYYKKQGLTLLDVLDNLFVKYGTYLESQQSFVFAGADGNEKMKNIIANLRNNIPCSIAGKKVVKYEDYGKKIRVVGNKEEALEGFDQSDVFKYFLEDGTWIAIRPSGTEPKIKIYYCIKGKDKADVLGKQNKYHSEAAMLVQ